MSFKRLKPSLPAVKFDQTFINYFVSGSQSKLTSDALRKHDNFMGTEPEWVDTEEDETEIAESLGGKSFKTFQTFASDWSACSNVSFSK